MKKASTLMAFASIAAIASMGTTYEGEHPKGTKYATFRKTTLNPKQTKARKKSKSARKARRKNRK